MHELLGAAGIFSGIESNLSLPAEPASASRARSFVRDLLAAWGAESLEEPATLLTSELVTNAVLHARSSVEVTVRLREGQLWVGVSDGNTGAPVRKRYGPDAATGRGLLLVERIASAWGTDLSATGKVVWFCLEPGAEEKALAALTADFDQDLADLPGGPPAGDSDTRLRRGRPGPRAVARRHHPAHHREDVFG
jgi:anti-sigma regulatory factor (Ser/Thr protein kinase)